MCSASATQPYGVHKAQHQFVCVSLQNAKTIDLDATQHCPSPLVMSPDSSVDAKLAVADPPAMPVIDKRVDVV